MEGKRRKKRHSWIDWLITFGTWNDRIWHTLMNICSAAGLYRAWTLYPSPTHSHIQTIYIYIFCVLKLRIWNPQCVKNMWSKNMSVWVMWLNTQLHIASVPPTLQAKYLLPSDLRYVTLRYMQERERERVRGVWGVQLFFHVWWEKERGATVR